MKLQSAKTKIKNAIQTLLYAKSRGLRYSNYPMIEFNKCLPKMETSEDYEKLQQWYNQEVNNVQ